MIIVRLILVLKLVVFNLRFKRDLNVLLLLFVVFVGVFPVSAASAGNQSVSVGCNVQPYIGIDMDTNSITWGNLTPGTGRVYSSKWGCTDDSNVPINLYSYIPEPFSGPETLNQSIVGYWGVGLGTPILILKNWTVPVNGVNHAYYNEVSTFVNQTCINGTLYGAFYIELPSGVLPGNYSTTLYNYCEAYTGT